jgi:hypothetical protein
LFDTPAGAEGELSAMVSGVIMFLGCDNLSVMKIEDSLVCAVASMVTSIV